MKRDVTLEEISDGRLYGRNDMVKADCRGCKGCSECCQGMGESIILDPLDISRLTWNLGLSFEQLLAEEKLELHVVDGVILPNLKMAGSLERCVFLNPDGRCGIHPFRPGICRLFPLGRFYEDRDFQYFLQIHECPHPSRTKVKVRKWIDTPDIKQYDSFIKAWHYFLSDLEAGMEQSSEEEIREWNLYVLKHFYQTPFEKETDFYQEFQDRLRAAKVHLAERGGI